MKKHLTDFCSFLEKEGILIGEVRPDVIDEFIKELMSRADELTRIAMVVSDHYDMPIDMLNRHTRARIVVGPRQMAMYMMVKYTEKSNAVIGAFFQDGNHFFDHATVTHSVKTVDNLRQTDNSYRKVFYEVDRKVRVWFSPEKIANHEKTRALPVS